MEMNFTKPSGTDNFSIETQNENWNKAQIGFHQMAPGIVRESEQGAMATVNDSSDNPMFATLHGATIQSCEVETTLTESDGDVSTNFIPWNKGDVLEITLNTPKIVWHAEMMQDGSVIGTGGDGGVGYDAAKEVWGFKNTDGSAALRFDIEDATADDVISVKNLISPTHEVPIHGAGESGSIEVVSCGKNLLKNKGEHKNTAGVTWVINEDGSVTVNGTATTTAFVGLNGTKDFPPTMKKGVEYIVSGGVENVALRIYERKNDGEELILYSASSSRSFKYTIADDVTAVHFRFYATIGVAIKNLTLYPMVRLATVEDSTWEPYVETTADIPLSSPLYEGDYIHYNMDGSGELIRKMQSVVFNGDENGWGPQGKTETAQCFGLKTSLPADMTNRNALCTHFTKVYNTQTDKVEGTFSFNPAKAYSDHIYFNIGLSAIGIDGTEDAAIKTTAWKAWLAENKPKVVCELAEPTVIPLTAEQIAELKKLRSFYHVTHATIDEGKVSFKYIADTKKYIDNKFEELQNAILTSV